MRIAVCGDIHAHNYSQYAATTENGLNSRLVWILKALASIIAISEERGVNAIVIAGDLFHSRKAIDVTVLDSVYSVLSEAKIPVYILKGNHDISNDGLRVSIKVFERIARVITTPTYINIADKIVGFVPWSDSPEDVGGKVRILRTKGATCLIGHFGVKGAIVGAHEYVMEGGVQRGIFKKFDWVALAHYHKHQKIRKNVYYVGSPLQHTWSESGNKNGFMIFGGARPEFVPLSEFPRFVKVTHEDEMESVRDIDYVKIVADEDTISRIKPRKGMKVIQVQSDEEDVNVRIAFDQTSLRNILDRYVVEFQQDMVDNKFLVEVGLDYLKE